MVGIIESAMVIAISMKNWPDGKDLLAAAIQCIDRQPGCRVGVYALGEEPKKTSFFDFGNWSELMAGCNWAFGHDATLQIERHLSGHPSVNVLKQLEGKLFEAHASIAYCRTYAEGLGLGNREIEELNRHIRGLLRQLNGLSDQLDRIVSNRSRNKATKTTGRLVPFETRRRVTG